MGARDYSPTAASNLSVGGISIAEGMARASVNNAMRQQLADTANLLLDQGGGTLTTGSGNAYILDLPTTPTAYANNLSFICRLNHGIAHSATININGLGVKPFKKMSNGVPVDMGVGDGEAGHRAQCIYSTADNAVLMLNPGRMGSSFSGSGSLDWVSVGDYGLIADGATHPLSSRYASLALAQEDYPFATSLTQQIDYCACKAASNAAFGADLQFELDPAAWRTITASSGGTTIQDNTRAWTPLAGTAPGDARGEHGHKEVYRRKAGGELDHGLIISNTANTLTVGVSGGTGSYGTPTALTGGPVTAGEEYQIVYRVTGTATDTTHITDLTQSWTVDEHAGKVAFRRFLSTGGGSTSASADAAPILSNTADTLTLASPLPSAVGATNLYSIGEGEHGDSTTLNRPLWLPPGFYQFGTDTWTIRKLKGGRIEGAGEQATIIRGNKTLLRFDGIWYSELSNFSLQVQVANVDETAALDMDGNVPGHPYATCGVQGVTLRNMLISGGGSKYAFILCRQGGGNAQGSECLFEKVHLQHTSFACYYQNGMNALANTFMGGNFQNYLKYGAYILGGTFAFINTGFQSTQGYRQLENAGADIRCGDSGAYEGCLIHGCRSESLVFLHNAGAVRCDVRACVVRTYPPGGWTAGTTFGAAANSYKAIIEAGPASPAIYTNRLFVATTEGTTGGVEPNWDSVATGGTIADGTVVWTETPFDSLYNFTGSVDVKTVAMYAGNTVTAPRNYYRRTYISSLTATSTIVGLYEDGIFVDTTNTTGGTVTITSPTIPNGSVMQGREFFVKKTDLSANTVTITLVGGFEHGAGTVILPGGARGYKRFMFTDGTGGSRTWMDVS